MDSRDQNPLNFPKSRTEWNLNEWEWDGLNFVAKPRNLDPEAFRSKQIVSADFDNLISSNFAPGRVFESRIVEKELEKRRRIEGDRNLSLRIAGDSENLNFDKSFGVGNPNLSLRIGGDSENVNFDRSLSLRIGGDSENVNFDGSLSLRAGGELGNVNFDRSDGRKGKVICQVEGCGSDLSESRDYHRRHKVCEVHAKAATAVVGNVAQRFCQQCSRFHLLQEFDEGKRSCRRRLAGHNKRRRKTQADASVSGNSVMDEQTSSNLLISLLRILSSLHSDNSERTKDQELLVHLLKNLGTLASSLDVGNLSQLLQTSQHSENHPVSPETSKELANPSISGCVLSEIPSGAVCPISSALEKNGYSLPFAPTVLEMSLRGTKSSPESAFEGVKVKDFDLNDACSDVEDCEDRSGKLSTPISSALEKNGYSLPVAPTVFGMSSRGIGSSPESAAEGGKVKDFDLNDACSDVQDYQNGFDKPSTSMYTETVSPNCPSWALHDSHQSSLPQTSSTSVLSAQSLSNSGGDIKCRTDRIDFKLFGKDPTDIPVVLRAQILEWLSHSPTDIESCIRPGCVVLSIYLRTAESAWEELYEDLGSSLNRILHSSTDDFWRTGWIFARVRNQIALVYNGNLVLEMPFLVRYPPKIFCVAPIAVPYSSRASFTIKGFNLAQPTIRMLCSLEGTYLVQEPETAHVPATDSGAGAFQDFSFICSVPNVKGRGFFEVENEGICNGFFPFVVSEEDVCSEVRMLESSIDVDLSKDEFLENTDAHRARNQSLEFIHEFGWLLRRNHTRAIFEELRPFPHTYSLARFRWLISFSLNQEWPAVLKQLLDILFSGTVETGSLSPAEVALSDNLLHNAVQRTSKIIVELLLRYVPDKSPPKAGPVNFLFRPDMLGPSNITPLHIAASSSGAEGVLDALTSDPQQLGIRAWNTSRDSSGFTPEDYACARGHNSYLLLVQNKIDNLHGKGQLVDISGDCFRLKCNKVTSLEIQSDHRIKEKTECKSCSQQLAYLNPTGRMFLYRPAMLSVVCIAAVCVCVGIILKSLPKVCDISRSFRWEWLEYGPS